MQQNETMRTTTPSVSVRALRFDATPVLLGYLLLVSFIPARWVFPGLGAAGRPASLFGVAMLLLWAMIQFLPAVTTRPTRLRWFVLVNGVVLTITYALAQGRGLTEAESLSADRALITLLSVSGVLLMSSEGIPSFDRLDWLTKRITYIGAGVAAIGLIQFLLRIDPYSFIRFPVLRLNNEISQDFGVRGGGLVRVRGSTLHPIEFSVLMALALPLAIHHAIHEASVVLRRRRQLIAIVIAGSAMLSVSRSAVVSMACCLLVLFVAWSPKLRLAAIGAAVFFVAGLRVLVPGLVGTLRSLFVNLLNDPSVTGRTADFGRIAPYVEDRPWFGRGVGTFLPDLYVLLDNTYLGRLVSTGIFGLAALVALLLAALTFSRRCVRRSPDNQIRHLGVAVSAMILAGIVSGALFDFLFFPTASGFYYVALGAAAFMGTHHGEGFAMPRPERRGVLHPKHSADLAPTRWWHRFDPELRRTSPDFFGDVVGGRPQTDAETVDR